MLDLKNVNFGTQFETIKIDGIYEKIKNNKVIFIDGIRFNNIAYQSGFYNVVLKNQAYEIVVAVRRNIENKKVIKTTIVIQPSDIIKIIEK